MDEPYQLTNSTFLFFHAAPSSRSISGGFSISSAATAGQQLDVRVIETLAHPDNLLPPFNGFQTGLLEVTAENGDRLRLDADTGSLSTVSVEIIRGGVTEQNRTAMVTLARCSGI